MKYIVLASISFVLVLACSEATLACWCRREVYDTEKKFRAAVAKELRSSFIVFSGEAVERNRAGLKFRVEKVWKGEVTNEIILTSKNYVVQGDCTEQDPCYFTSCVYPFELGKRYLVYAYVEADLLNVSLCSRTELFEKAEQDIIELDRITSKNRKGLKSSNSSVELLKLNAKSNNGMHPTAYSFARRSSSLRFRRRVSFGLGGFAVRDSEEIMNTQTLIATLEAAPGIIIGLVREVPPQNLKRRPAPNKWSAHEHACHISSGHAAFLSRLELMLSDPFPKIKSMEPSPDEEAGSLLSVDLDEALDLYVRERALVVKRLKELSAEDWQRTAEHEAFSHYSVYIMFRHLLMHEMLHAYRIDELMLKKDWE